MFDETVSRPILSEVCHRLGFDPHEALLLRHHTNAVYAIDDAVIKIAPSSVSVARLHPVIEMVHWLTDAKFPTALLYPTRDPQPLHIDGHAVTVWHRMDARDRPVTIGELGHLLKRLHSLAPPAAVTLPNLDPIRSIAVSVNKAGMLDDGDRELLMTRLLRLEPIWAEISSSVGNRLIQTDPQVANTLRRRDGVAVLSDWDGISLGPAEWDIATVAVHCQRFQQHSFDDFATAYGLHQARTGFRAIIQLRELQMIATNARKSPPGTPAAHQVRHRIDDLRHPAKAVWTIL